MNDITQMFLFVLVMSLSPGPNNILSAAYGKRKGFFKALNFVTGAAVGFALLTLILGLGTVSIFESAPLFLITLKYLGGIYLIVLAVLMIVSTDDINISGGKRGTFWEGFLIQLINPKSWLSALIGVSSFGQTNEKLIVFSLFELSVGWCSLAFWAYAGEFIARKLKTPKQQMILNGTLGISLIVVAINIMI